MADDLEKTLLAAFADESLEMVQTAARLVVKLEHSEGEETKRHFEDLRRTAHNLKGAAATLGFDRAARLVHLVETLIGQARGAASLDRKVADLVLEGLDVVATHVRAVAQGQTKEEAIKMLEDPLARVEAEVVAEGLTPASFGRDVRPPAASPPTAGRTDLRSKGSGSADAPLPAAMPAESEAFTVRVATSRLEAVFAGAEEVHGLRNRLETRELQAASLTQLLEACLRRLKPVGARPALEALRTAYQAAITLAQDVQADAQAAEGLAQSLGEDIRSLRTVPAAGLIDALERSTRDHARKVGKELKLSVEGRNVEVDRLLLDELKAPLVHLLRNAVDHGIEGIATRRERSKPVVGTIVVRLAIAGELLRVVVEDDGAGVDLARVRDRAVERGLMTREQAETASEPALVDLLFTASFSTAQTISETSGRGVGLDVVRGTVAKLRGTVRLEFQPLLGSRFTIEVPLTVTATHALLVQVGNDRVAVPAHAVKTIRTIQRDEIRVVRGLAYIDDASGLVPLERLGGAIGLAAPPQPYGRQVQLVILSSGVRVAAFAVSDYEDEVELVVKPAPPELRSVRHMGGLAVLGSGEPVVVLEPDQLVRTATGRTGLPDPAAPSGRYTVLVADDSATTRMLHQSALEAAGFNVLTASDGDEALRMLSAMPCDAVVADVRMPRMSGIELVRALRQHPRLKTLPLMLCTSMDSDEERQEGLSAGANAFLPKGQWEQGLLAQMVRSILRGERQ